MKKATAERHCCGVNRVIGFVTRNASEPCTLEQLSRVAFQSPFHLHRVFKEITGVRLNEFVREVRLELSAHYLLHSRLSVTEIALSVGYHSLEAFSRAFHAAYAMSPTHFREAYALSDHGGDGSVAAPEPGADGSLALGTLEPCRVLFRSWFGGYHEIERCWREVYARLRDAGVPVESVRAIGAVHDDPFLGRKSIRYDACVVVPEGEIDCPSLGVKWIAGVDTVATRYEGVVSATSRAFVRLCTAWTMHAGGRRLRRFPYFEVYQHPPFLHGRPDVAVDVHVPLA